MDKPQSHNQDRPEDNASGTALSITIPISLLVPPGYVIAEQAAHSSCPLVSLCPNPGGGIMRAQSKTFIFAWLILAHNPCLSVTTQLWNNSEDSLILKMFSYIFPINILVLTSLWCIWYFTSNTNNTEPLPGWILHCIKIQTYFIPLNMQPQLQNHFAFIQIKSRLWILSLLN